MMFFEHCDGRRTYWRKFGSDLIGVCNLVWLGYNQLMLEVFYGPRVENDRARFKLEGFRNNLLSFLAGTATTAKIIFLTLAILQL